MGDLAAADRDSADMAARLLPGQAPYPALHLYAWRALALDTLGRWDEAVAVFWRAIDAWHDAGSHAAGYGLRGFCVGLDIGRARGDTRLSGAAADAMESILARFPANHINRAWTAFIRGEPTLDNPDIVTTRRFPFESAERLVNLMNDLRVKIPEDVVTAGVDNAARRQLPLLHAQLLRSRAILRSDASDMNAALAIWERIEAVPLIGRARAERGLITGNDAEIEAGLALLKRLGDVNYVDRFAARV